MPIYQKPALIMTFLVQYPWIIQKKKKKQQQQKGYLFL